MFVEVNVFGDTKKQPKPSHLGIEDVEDDMGLKARCSMKCLSLNPSFSSSSMCEGQVFDKMPKPNNTNYNVNHCC